MVRNYIVYGVDAKGQLHEIKKTPTAREARVVRDAEAGHWTRTEVFGADGALSVAALNDLSDKGHRYA